MARATSVLASAAVGGLLVVTAATVAQAQDAARPFLSSAVRPVSPAPGSIAGFIHDERGLPVANAVVSILGAITTVAVTDEDGRFEFGVLTPGAYLVRAHLAGYVAPRARVVHVRASARASSTIALRREGSPPVLMAGIGAGGLFEGEAPGQAPDDTSGVPASAGAPTTRDNPGETAWRIRHGRRGILKDATLPEELLTDLNDDEMGGVVPIGRAIGTPDRLATSFFSDTDFRGQLNLLTAGSFESPQQLFSAPRDARSVANVRVGAPVGQHADWTVAGALTEADVSSWVVAGSYSMRAPARHRYDVGMSYSTQRYAGGNPLALRNVTDGSRNAGVVYAYDSFSVSPSTTVSFGTEYARYDYVDQRGLVSPRVELTVSPRADVRVVAGLSQRALAPGAQEFALPGDAGVWLPPQRTFSSINTGGGRFQAERALQARVGIERDLGTATIGVRAFHQVVNDQLVTVFGASPPGQPSANVGHYLVGNTGDIDVNGCTAELRAVVASRIHGSVEYSLASARLVRAGDQYLMLLTPMGGPVRRDVVHDVKARVETEVQETATRFLLLYRVSNAFAQPGSRSGRGVGSRFDVQIRQGLPFMNFSSARLEMLLAVRNFFHDGTSDQSLYDELFVVRPPKRIVGGVTLHF